jgi:hypothetical protein
MNSGDTARQTHDDAAIAAFMQRVSRLPPPAGWSLPAAHSVLRQAHWRQRWEGERRMHLPLDIVMPLQIAAALATIAVLLVRAVPWLAVTLQNLS